MKMERSELKKFRSDFAATVEDLEKKYGVKIDIGNISFSADEFHTKMTVKNMVGADGAEIDLERKEFERDCILFGLNKEDYLREVKLHGHSETYVIYGVNTNASKNTIRIREKYTGKQYVCPKSLIVGIA